VTRRKPLLVLLCAVVLLTSCRSWQRYPNVSVQDMYAGLQGYMHEYHPLQPLPALEPGRELEVNTSSSTNGWLVLFFVLTTAGLLLPLGQDLTVALRGDGGEGCELAVEATSGWLLFYALPVTGHEEGREQFVRDAILAQARQRRTEQRQASQTIYALLDAVRGRKLDAFRALLWRVVERPERAAAWLDDEGFWSAVRAQPTRAVHVSWPAHERTITHSQLFGLTHTTERYRCLWVDVELGPETQRFEVVQDGQGFKVALPIGEDGRLQR
jgi:hypothetical protein